MPIREINVRAGGSFLFNQLFLKLNVEHIIFRIRAVANAVISYYQILFISKKKFACCLWLVMYCTSKLKEHWDIDLEI
jgi:hypothetical protein